MEEVCSFDVAVAKNIRALRKTRGLSQPRVAGVLQIAYQSYQKLENGKVKIKAKTVWTLAELFGVSPEALIEGADAHLPNSAAASAIRVELAEMSAADASHVVDFAYKVRKGLV